MSTAAWATAESPEWAVGHPSDATADLVTETRVHFELAFSRFHRDGTRYLTVPAVWTATEVDGRWAMQFRSLALPPSV